MLLSLKNLLTMKFIAVWQYKNSFTTALLHYKIYYQYKRQEFQTIIFTPIRYFHPFFQTKKRTMKYFNKFYA